MMKKTTASLQKPQEAAGRERRQEALGVGRGTECATGLPEAAREARGGHSPAAGGPGRTSREDRLRRRLRRLAALHAQIAQVYRDISEEVDIQLAGAPPESVHATAPEGTGMNPTEGTPTTDAGPERLLDATGLAEVLGCGERTVRRLRSEGKLPAAVEIGGLLRWRPDAIERWLEEQER